MDCVNWLAAKICFILESLEGACLLTSVLCFLELEDLPHVSKTHLVVATTSYRTYCLHIPKLK